MREFDADTIGLITSFENMTGTEVRDCLKNDSIYFLVNEGKAAMAIGKGGQTIKNAERALKKQIKIFEWSRDENIFVKNLIPQAENIVISNDKAIISLNNKNKGIVIGKDGKNINIIRELLKRNSNIKDLKIS